MSLLSAHDLHKSYGPSQLLKGASLAIADRERVGLVGRNGSGKSTLARIIAGIEAADFGTVNRRRGAPIAFLAQEPQLDPDRTGRSLVLAGLEEWDQARERHEIASRSLELGSGDFDALLEQQAEAAATVERLGGWDISHRAESMMTRLGVLHPDRPVGTLSGGERRRIALARILVSRPALAVLDEPTNHLDAETIEWLENHLVEEHEGALLLITHDRWVLDRVVERTLELEAGQVYSYDGGWEEYLVAKAERQDQANRTESNRQNLLRTELEWLRRQPKARTGKQKARIQRAEGAMQAPRPSTGREVKLEIQTSGLGSTVLELHDLGIDMGERRLVDSLTLHLTKGERLGVIGRNGTGKTTLLRCLLGDLPATRGRVVRGARIRFAYFDQGREGLVDSASIVENVAGQADTVHLGGTPLSIYSYLDRFLFHGDRIRQKVGSLSGGERARVALAKMLLEPANVILMDEPTNDLDVDTLCALEQMLTETNSTLLVVTHDRYFLDRVATGILAFEGNGRVVAYPGNYGTFQSLRAEREQALRDAAAEAESRPTPTLRAPAVTPATDVSTKAANTAKSPKKKGLTWAEQKELGRIEADIAEAESSVSAHEAVLADPLTYSARAAEIPDLLSALAGAQKHLEALMGRWIELETKRSEALDPG